MRAKQKLYFCLYSQQFILTALTPTGEAPQKEDPILGLPMGQPAPIALMAYGSISHMAQLNGRRPS